MMKHILTAVALCGAMALAKTVAPSTQGRNSSSFTGTVGQFLLAPHGEVEGLLLKDGTSVLLSSRAADELTKHIKPGDKIVVSAATTVPPSSPQGRGVKANAVTTERSNKTITDQPPGDTPADTRRASGRRMEVRGKIVRVLRDEKGNADGVLLTGGQQVRLDSEWARELAKLNEDSPGSEVRVAGMGVKNDFGTVVDAVSVKYAGRLLGPKSPAASVPAGAR